MSVQPVNLNNAALSSLPPHILRPAYDRAALRTGIVHVGVGGFHRAHQAFYTDQFMGKSGNTNWGICGIGLREGDSKIRDVLKKQDYLYSLLVKDPEGCASLRVIGCMTGFLMANENPKAVIDKMASPDTKIVSLTITEGGYNFIPSTGEFDFSHADVQHDLANPDSPRLVFGYLASALKQRRASGLAPFTVQSCDNIQHNGDVTRKMLTSYIRSYDEEMADWVSENVAFPNAMVDRITPVTTADDIAQVAALGLNDEWPVTCEPFHQWVIEERFSDGRPGWEKTGAQFVEDVTPYETMKIRLLNAGHTVLGILGSLHGFSTIDETVAHPVFASFVRRFMDTEATPVLSPVAGINLDEYKNTLIARFANPFIKDSLTRICSQSASKISTFLVPTIKENVEQKGQTECAALVIAAWCYYSYYRATQQGTALEVIDDHAEILQSVAGGSESQARAFIGLSDIFGNLAKEPAFADPYLQYVSSLFNGEPVQALIEKTNNHFS